MTWHVNTLYMRIFFIMFAQFVPGFKQSFTYSVQRIIIHIQNQNRLRLRTDLRCRGFGLYHGLVNYIDTKAKCHHPKNGPVKGFAPVLIRVCRREIQSVMLVFFTQLCKLLPLKPSLWFNSLPPPPSLCQSTVHTYSVQLGGDGGVESC